MFELNEKINKRSLLDLFHILLMNLYLVLGIFIRENKIRGFCFERANQVSSPVVRVKNIHIRQKKNK